MENQLLYILAAVLVLGVGAQWLSWRLRTPSILALLILGIVAGPVTGLLRPDEQFGDLLFPFISLGVALVLFEGGLTLRFRDLRGHGRTVTNLVSWGALLNWLLIAGGCVLLAGFTPYLALLFAALMVVTGPTVINPLLRTMRARADVSQVLRWEGILIDPVGALLAVLVFQYLVTGSQGFMVFGKSIAAGLGVGIAGAFSLGFALRRHWVPEYLANVVTLAWVVLVFAASDYTAHESGLLAVTVMGVLLGNMKDVDVSEILSFKESLSILVISVLFVVLGARVDPMDILATGWSGAAVLLVVLLARPVMVWACTLGAGYSWQQRALLAWVAPRGIVAAAVSSLFALRLADAGYADAVDLVPYTFLVIIATVVLQSITARPVTRALGLAEEEPNGMLIVGANRVARAIGDVLQRQGFRIKLADTSYEEVRAARMVGLETYFGDPVSSHADQYLERVGIGWLFAVSRRSRWNTLACMKFRSEFGPNRVFSLRTGEDRDASERERLSEDYQVPRMFSEDLSYEKFASLLAQGAELKVINLTESFDLDNWKQTTGNRLIPLFALGEGQKLRVCTQDEEPPLDPGSKLVALVWAAPD
ncbi:sodium/hydrogen exchanger family protein [Luminiphilus syltensis NOR5-1B]|uniref:Sodium/hydrogen exchanger family protein n=1 Tax=Luminiphilus syltensis NOR5-1B TaxID=565045 RepID=B8KX82_9GAMM|nr:sodium:proton antiporter [Luminiphilus syltensis]EED36040.1 sodium/hydrogen exchanger family protein [Luminiphilus syltensis NOR5-1B]